MRLSDCLAAMNWRTLAAIAQTHRLPLSSQPTRADLMAALTANLPRRVASMRQVGLDIPIVEALTALAAAEGQAPLPDFVVAYGDARSLTGARERDPRHLARQPASTTEWLLFHGLAFIVPPGNHGDAARIVLPDEWLTDFRPQPPDTRDEPTVETTHWPDASLALAVYLAALRATPPRLSKASRLRAVTLHQIALLLGQRATASSATDWLGLTRFIEFLAWRLGLTLPLGRHLHLSPLAAAWLDQPWRLRRADLWRAWLDEADLPSAWRRYRLPAATLSDPAAFAHRLLDRLRAARQSSDGQLRPWRTIDDLIPLDGQGPLLTGLIPWWETENRPGLGYDLARQIMRGPLAWLGALEWEAVSPPRWRLTDLGAWYLGLGANPPPEPAPPPLQLLAATPDSDSIDNHPLSAPLGATTLSLADWLDVKPGPPHSPWPPHLLLTPASVTRGLRRGGIIDDLLRLLTATARPAPSDTLEATLRVWARSGDTFQLRPTVVLRAPSESHLDALLRSRVVRRSVTRRLSTTDVEVDPTHLSHIDAALRRLGHALDTASLKVVAPAPPPERQGVSLNPSDLTWLLTSVEGYADLARRLALPPPPTALADRLAAHLDPTAREGARHAAQHAADRLDRTLRDLEPALAPVPIDTLLALFESALATSATLHILYWTPSRPTPLARTVSPQRIEWHGDTPYLAAYCHLRRDERTFRLDRILAVDIIQS